MNRNEYRRAFIMLRAAMQGYGGHVRLERRTMTGSMYFIVTAPEGAGTLRAALAGQRDGRYYAVPLGELSRDRRGQLTLAWQFDPRSIDGRPLEAYAWVAVADAGRGCALALTGNVEGARELDPAALARAVCERFAADAAPADDLPAPDAQQSRDDMQGDVKIYTGSRARVCAAAGMDSAEPGAPDGTVASDAIILETIPEGGASKEQTVVCIPANAELHSPTVPAAPGGSSAGKADFTASDEAKAEAVSPDVPAPGIDVAKEQTPVCNSESTAAAPAAESVSVESGEIPSTASPDASPSQPPVDASRTPEQTSELRLSAGQTEVGTQAGAATAPQTAARQLRLDITRPWSGALEPLRRLFATQAPVGDNPGGEYVYISAPMPAASGFSACLIGLSSENGRVTGLRYALPARYAPLPPAGLEGYRWLGGGGSGYWVLDVEAEQAGIESPEKP